MVQARSLLMVSILISCSAFFAYVLVIPNVLLVIQSLERNYLVKMKRIHDDSEKLWNEINSVREDFMTSPLSESLEHLDKPDYGRYIRQKPPEPKCDCRGYTGNSCPPGRTGPVGPKGYDGRPGIHGVPGEPGRNYYVPPPETKDNLVCEVCPRGSPGPRGYSGKPGPKGPKGFKGKEGPKGKRGSRGDIGYQGKMGSFGSKGRPGIRGVEGQNAFSGIGKKGNQGEPGKRGLIGAQGVPGIIGARGLTGPDGDAGLTGEPGYDGPKGRQGDQGPPGLPGIEDGHCVCPSNQTAPRRGITSRPPDPEESRPGPYRVTDPPPPYRGGPDRRPPPYQEGPPRGQGGPPFKGWPSGPSGGLAIQQGPVGYGSVPDISGKPPGYESPFRTGNSGQLPTSYQGPERGNPTYDSSDGRGGPPPPYPNSPKGAPYPERPRGIPPYKELGTGPTNNGSPPYGQRSGGPRSGENGPPPQRTSQSGNRPPPYQENPGNSGQSYDGRPTDYSDGPSGQRYPDRSESGPPPYGGQRRNDGRPLPYGHSEPSDRGQPFQAPTAYSGPLKLGDQPSFGGRIGLNRPPLYGGKVSYPPSQPSPLVVFGGTRFQKPPKSLPSQRATKSRDSPLEPEVNSGPVEIRDGTPYFEAIAQKNAAPGYRAFIDDVFDPLNFGFNPYAGREEEKIRPYATRSYREKKR